jgi:sortase A
VPVIDNDDPDSLREGVGHVPGTAVAGGLGNLVLAGHRDTFLRALRNIRTGMPIRVVSSEGTFLYVTDSTEIVMPEDVQVADMGRRPEMTLITCYPFNYIGAAPKRFIVHAHLLSLIPS